MKPDSTPTPPDDETPDPLLTALRQRLGDYGQDPPPAAWAAIRQRVAAPRPWWRRPRRLLPLLALLLGVLLVGVLAERHGQLRTTAQPVARRAATASLPEGNALTGSNSATKTNAASARPNTLAGNNSTSSATTSARLAAAGPSHPLVAPLSTTTSAATRLATASARRLAPAALAAGSARQRGKKASVAASMSGLPAARQRPVTTAAAASAQKLTPALAATGNRLRRRTAEASAPQDAQYAASHKATAAILRPASRHATARLAGGRSLTSAQRASRKATVATGASAATSPPAAGRVALAGTKTRLHPIAATPARLPASQRRLRRGRVTHRLGQPADLPGPAAVDAPTNAPATLARTPATPAAGPLGQPSATERGAAIDLLALKQTSLLLPELALPTIAAAQPDSTPPAHAVRRWSLLLLAGPTLSYRTLGPAPTLAAGHPDFARLERPALGLGAQVQVRRVLSGRWAVAAGVGYHEYATRLALSVKDSNAYTTVRQRDTYRLLTVPVQFTYALGAPRGRLAVGLLAGAELGWYIGGRSTEGSDCGCQQQVYPADSARTSPYRPLSLAFSLGLDVRYRLGGPASRWHLVVQPTGRYVATPFVRSEAVGFTRRQPWSLGLMTGFSWDLR